MASAADKESVTNAQLADLSALADGSLDPARRDDVQAWIAASPELSALYERERRAVEILHRARTADRAPLALRERIEAQRPSARVRTRRRLGLGGALATGLAVIALALVLILPSGTPGAPSVSQAASLALRGAAAPAPTPDPDAPNAKLQRKVGDVYFPNWTQQFHWRAVGQRVDHINGRLAVTVYYQRGHERVAYTIVSAPALAAPAATITRLNNTELRTLNLSQRHVVTWRRGNHTCVLSGSSGLPASLLQRLAAWSGESTSA
jgi:anti-sigma factor RsiW